MQDHYVHAYKIQLTEEIEIEDRGNHLPLVQWVRNAARWSDINTNISKKEVIFSYEAHLRLNSLVNTQDRRIRDSANSYAIHKR